MVTCKAERGNFLLPQTFAMFLFVLNLTVYFMWLYYVWDQQSFAVCVYE